MNETDLLAAIQDVLSGNEWDSENCSRIAELLNDNGYTIDEYDNLLFEDDPCYE